MKNFKIAIDGPAGAGKSTISKQIADYFGFLYVDTGAMYRAVALKTLDLKIDINDNKSILKMLDNTDIKLQNSDSGQRVFLDGKDVTEKIRSPIVSSLASKVASIYEVREKLVKIQRDLANDENVVMDGRDIGTNVLPDAQIKIFLTASEHDRAMRRYEELKKNGIKCNFDDVLKDIIDRDHQDYNRLHSPLKKADDAYLIDTTGNSLEKSIVLICEFIKEKLR